MSSYGCDLNSTLPFSTVHRIPDVCIYINKALIITRRLQLISKSVNVSPAPQTKYIDSTCKPKYCNSFQGGESNNDMNTFKSTI